MDKDLTYKIDGQEIERMEKIIPSLVKALWCDEILELDSDDIKSRIFANFNKTPSHDFPNEGGKRAIGFSDASLGILTFVINNISDVLEELKDSDCLTESAIIGKLKERYLQMCGLSKEDLENERWI